MKSCEYGVLPKSEYYLYAPSVTAKETFFYPIASGHFYYDAGYKLSRNAYDSYLLLYLRSGKMVFHMQEASYQASQGDFMFINCYEPHSYESLESSDCLWLHFDGPMASAYCQLILDNQEPLIQLSEPLLLVQKLQQVYEMFHKKTPLIEAMFSKLISDMLTILLIEGINGNQAPYTNRLDNVIRHIHDHFSDAIRVDDLSAIAMMSPYHFIRVFKKETGYTPHEYLLQTRIQSAKYRLKSSQNPIKDICFDAGFSSESAFSTAFKRVTGMTPMGYRNNLPTIHK